LGHLAFGAAEEHDVGHKLVTAAPPGALQNYEKYASHDECVYQEDLLWVW
jgi:hypothetical protein